ncbi:unnamed protein product [Prunus brigantina]
MASSRMSSTASSSSWTAKQNKDFENTLAVFDNDTANRWDNVANVIGGKIQKKSRSIMSFLRGRNEGFKSFAQTTKQNKDFENALAVFDKDVANRWDNIAKSVGRKTLEEIKKYYDLLVEDIMSLMQIVLLIH